MRAILAALALSACAAEEPAPALTACEGDGPPGLEIGTGGIAAFDAWSDGSTVATSTAGDDVGIRVELLSTGLDTTGLVSVVVAVDAAGASEDALASVTLQCPSEGPGWIALFAPLPTEAQGLPVDGMPAAITATATDQAGDAASVGPLDVVLSGG
jgi:hypothetical protein